VYVSEDRFYPAALFLDYSGTFFNVFVFSFGGYDLCRTVYDSEGFLISC
jgi:hypothetical protein